MFTQIIRIIKGGITSLFYNIDGNKRSIFKVIFCFLIVPTLVALYVAQYVEDKDLKNCIDALLTCLSIFTALIFNVLFIVPDKLSQRIKDLKERNDDGTYNYLIRFLNFSKKFVNQIAFIIILCLILIVLLIIQKIDSNPIVIFINSMLFSILIMYLLSVLSNIFILLMDDIDKSGKDINRPPSA